jgi:hypothetical protein
LIAGALTSTTFKGCVFAAPVSNDRAASAIMLRIVPTPLVFNEASVDLT